LARKDDVHKLWPERTHCYLCENAKAVASTNVQDAEVVHEDAVQELIDAFQQDTDTANDDYYADQFLCKDQEHRSASFQIKDGINGGRIPKN
jgi:hypothetical protein